ncbi:TPA: hypothetical protein DCZ79_01585 [Candidatus Nomurabacteria bacterium]|nr:hypothetical protein [Candidatus Nomurabacteria bacterium]
MERSNMLCLNHRFMRKPFPVLFVFFFLGAFLFSSPKEALATDLPCTAFRNEGFLNYFFDNFEETEYQNGRLAYHFKLRDNVYAKDGRPWGSRMFFYNENCAEVGSFGVGANSNINASITPQTLGFSVRFASSTHYDIWNDDLGLKENCEACSVDIPAVLPEGKEYRYVVFRGIIDGGASMILSTSLPIQATSSPPEPPPPDPVIIIPGILGSSDKNGVWVIDPIFHTYDDLIETLKANGYVESANLFTMPYDWRQSNVLTAVQLENKIDEVQNVCHCAKVDLVAHSMGGLVARQYIQSGNYENDVDQLIFLGTPHLGAPFAYLMWEAGEIGTKTGNTGERLRDWFMKFVLGREAKKARYSSLFDYVRNKPISSVQELLPTYNYLRDKDSGTLRTYPNNYPQNTFLENLKTSVLSLFDKNIKITNVVGDLGDNSTLNAIRVVNSPSTPLWENGYPDGFDGSTADRGFEFGFGDGTVPAGSGEFIVSDLNQLISGHNALPTNAEGLIFKKLTGANAAILIDHGLSINPKLLLIKILSPVDVLVTAPDGKRIGKDFASGNEINQIDGAFYSGFLTDDEYITIPNPLDGEYKIEAQGTGSGEYTIATGYISDNISVDKDYTSQTQPGLITELDLKVNNESPTDLEIKPKDVTPPSINILSPVSRDYLRSETIFINVDVGDVESGIASAEIKFDDRMVKNGDIIDLFFEKLGEHKVAVNSVDFVGNFANQETVFRVIATIQSTISDIERVYSLGWITKKSVKNTLIGKLERIDIHNKPITQKTLKTFLAELEREHPKNINDQAYNLLKEDINWLLNNL